MLEELDKREKIKCAFSEFEDQMGAIEEFEKKKHEEREKEVERGKRKQEEERNIILIKENKLLREELEKLVSSTCDLL